MSEADIRTIMNTSYGPTPQQWTEASQKWHEEQIQIGQGGLSISRRLVPGDIVHTELHLEMSRDFVISDDVISNEQARAMLLFLHAFLNEEEPHIATKR